MNLPHELYPLGVLGPLAAFLSAFTWAVGSSTYARLSHEYVVFRIAISRALGALPLFILAGLITLGGPQAYIEALSALSAKQFLGLAYTMVATYALGDSLFLLATRSLGVPGALAIASSYPAWTAAAELLIHGQLPPPLEVLGMALAITGTVIVILHAPEASDAPHDTDPARVATRSRWRVLRGVGLAVASSLFWASNSVTIAAVTRGVSPAVTNSVRMLAGVLICYVIGVLSAKKGQRMAFARRPLLPGPVWLKSYWVFAFEAFGGAYLYVIGMVSAPLVVGATLASLSPVLVVPLAWMSRLEPVSWPRALGVGVTVLGLILLVLGSA